MITQSTFWCSFQSGTQFMYDQLSTQIHQAFILIVFFMLVQAPPHLSVSIVVQDSLALFGMKWVARICCGTRPKDITWADLWHEST